MEMFHFSKLSKSLKMWLRTKDLLTMCYFMSVNDVSCLFRNMFEYLSCKISNIFYKRNCSQNEHVVLYICPVLLLNENRQLYQFCYDSFTDLLSYSCT